MKIHISDPTRQLLELFGTFVVEIRGYIDIKVFNYRYNLMVDHLGIIWALMGENLSSTTCEQHRHRPACASAQSDQRLCFSLFRKYHMTTCCRWNFIFLASLCSWEDRFETRFVGHPKDRFSHDEAHIV